MKNKTMTEQEFIEKYKDEFSDEFHSLSEADKSEWLYKYNKLLNHAAFERLSFDEQKFRERMLKDFEQIS